MTVFFVLSLVFLGLFAVFVFLATFTDNCVPWISALVLCLILSLTFSVIWKSTMPPETLYKEKLEAVEKAEKDLQIFLIEHPQLKK